jgi:hypothetical protein
MANDDTAFFCLMLLSRVLTVRVVTSCQAQVVAEMVL